MKYNLSDLKHLSRLKNDNILDIIDEINTFKGAILNVTYPSLNGGTLEIFFLYEKR